MQTENHVRMADLTGSFLDLVREVVQDHVDEFGLVSIRENHPKSAHYATQSLFLRAPPWPLTAKEAHEDLRVVDWPLLQLDERFRGILVALQNVVGLPMARALVVNLRPGGKISEHRDEGAYAAATERFHYVVETNDQVTSTIAGETVHMPAGSLWWFNKDEPHKGENAGDSPRVHLIFDGWKQP